MNRTACHPSARHNHQNQRRKQGSVTNFNAGAIKNVCLRQLQPEQRQNHCPSRAVLVWSPAEPFGSLGPPQHHAPGLQMPHELLQLAAPGLLHPCSSQTKTQKRWKHPSKSFITFKQQIDGRFPGTEDRLLPRSWQPFLANTPPAEQKIKPAAALLAGEEGRDAQ